ncbi:Angiomotin_C domain-containing protein [Caenorhabditis elegans]|uniref:Angiomotin_C domain-containing protein n=1 Tax=Caenorhabditis elegans TaxID=6239 RepID=A0A8D9MTV9_CAEEL|nr:Angiomotin_C domain-containing protein [Caenorhabditis elegans]CCD63421.2 Angiomotin_C domain-containing protein [Caenorhabditis elegans]
MNRGDVIDPRSSDGTSSDQRRVHAVPPTPMYQGETNILDSLLKEAQLNPSLKASVMNHQAQTKSKDDDEKRLQKMLEKYQLEMNMQRANSRKDLHGSAGPSPISHSQPCLIASGSRSSDIPPNESKMSTSAYQRRASASGDQALDVPTLSQTNRGVSSNQKLIQILREENVHLKKELDAFKRSLSKLQQIEYSYARLEKEYEYLANERKKQENLELNVIIQLEKSVKKLTIERDDLQMRLEKASTEPTMVANLMLNEIQQRQELFACKERQKMEIEAQNQTLEEQRNHIAMLEKALANSQERLAKREKKCEELSAVVAHADELRKQLNEVWEEQHRRDQMVESERAQWEMEKTQLRMQLNKDTSLTGSLKRTTTPGSTEDLIRMRKSIQSKDDKIQQLERMVNDLRKTHGDKTEQRKSTLATITDNFETQVDKLKEESYEKDLIINELRSERDKYAAMVDKNSGDEALSRMEEIRQKIQERKKKGRMGVTGGLSEHARTSSGSLMQNSLHRRSSSGSSFDPVPTAPIPYNMFKNSNNNKSILADNQFS